jgi:L-2-hydroxyglutarate oxidase
MRFTLIGGGLVGLATAYELKRLCPDADVQVFEKEAKVCLHQSTRNSGVLHAGLYYRPGSLRAKLAVQGIRRMTEFCRENGVDHQICGKVVVATAAAEVSRLKDLLVRGNQNGLRDLRWLSSPELREFEPHAAGINAIHVPEEGIVDYAGVGDALLRRLAAVGVTVTTSAPVRQVRRDGRGWVLVTGAGDFRGDFLINCAGLYCDRVAQAAGEHRTTRIVPFRGEYYKLKASAQGLVRNLIYPVPDPTFPFLGVHFTRLIHGGIEAGPNAVLAFAREGYTKGTINLADLADALGFRGLWSFVRKHKAMVWSELRRSYSRRLFCQTLQRLVPEIQESDLELGGSGVRAQALQPDGTLVQDFQVIERPNALHILSAPSPAATACLAIGEYVATKALGLTNQPGFPAGN